MNPFITYRDKDEKGNLQYYILEREFPHFIGCVSSVPIAGTWQSPIAGYMLWVVFSGTLRGNMVPGYNSINDEIQLILDAMAEWYCINRIMTEEKKYKRFKIYVSSPVQ